MLNQDAYLDFVMSEAKKIGKVFILDTGEGRDFIDPKTDWYIEDLSGWLINVGQQEQFVEARKAGKQYELFGDNYIFAIWEKKDNGELIINFKKYL